MAEEAKRCVDHSKSRQGRGTGSRVKGSGYGRLSSGPSLRLAATCSSSTARTSSTFSPNQSSQPWSSPERQRLTVTRVFRAWWRLDERKNKKINRAMFSALQNGCPSWLNQMMETSRAEGDRRVTLRRRIPILIALGVLLGLLLVSVISHPAFLSRAETEMVRSDSGEKTAVDGVW